MTLVIYRQNIVAHQVDVTDTVDSLNALVTQIPHMPIPQPLFAAATDGSNAPIGLWDGLFYYNQVTVGSYIVAVAPGSLPQVWDTTEFQAWYTTA